MASKADQNGEKPAVGEPKTMFVTVEGHKIHSAFEKSCKRPMKEHVELLKAMEMRHDDVMLMAYPKSGTHWIWEVISMLLAGKAEYEKRTKEFTMMEASQIEMMESEASPRVLNSHLPFRLLPRQILEKKVKVIHIYRNPKDVMVSGYFHFRQIKKDLTLEEVEKMLLNPEAEGDNYFQYMKEMDEFRKSNPDYPFLYMSFEDTKEDPGKAVKNLAEFLGVEATPQLCADVVEATRFNKMKEANKSKHQSDLPGTSQMYRKGEVGDWKNYLTVAQSERIDVTMTHLKSCDYNFRFTL